MLSVYQISECDYVCTTLLELELVDAETLAKVREQFYRLDTRAAGFLSMQGYLDTVMSNQAAPAKGRWRYAAAATMQEQRVLRRLHGIGGSFGSSFNGGKESSFGRSGAVGEGREGEGSRNSFAAPESLC